MKKLILALVMVGLLVGQVSAASLDLGDELEKLPDMQQGIFYDFEDNEIEYMTSIKVAEWNDINLEIAYSSEDAVLGVISYNLIALKDIIEFPILDLIEFAPGVAFGMSRIEGDLSAEFQWGLTFSFIKVRF